VLIKKRGESTVDQRVGLKQIPAQLPSPTPQCCGGTEYESLSKSEKGYVWGVFIKQGKRTIHRT